MGTGENRREIVQASLYSVPASATTRSETRTMQHDAIPASPNLDSLARNRPSSKRALVRLLWPKIKASLDVGHTVREVLDKLRLDGIELSYPSLCRYVSEFRQVEPGTAEPTTTQRSQEKRARPDQQPSARRDSHDHPKPFARPSSLHIPATSSIHSTDAVTASTAFSSSQSPNRNRAVHRVEQMSEGERR